jgi:RecB family endonuclease NucS
MPINQTLWRISKNIQEIKPTQLDSESELEGIIELHIELLNPNWLIIGRQVPTAYNHYIDLLAINDSGAIIIIELKRHKTPRDVIAQGLDYASWVQDLDSEDIAKIFSAYDHKYLKSGKSLDACYPAPQLTRVGNGTDPPPRQAN